MKYLKLFNIYKAARLNSLLQNGYMDMDSNKTTIVPQ